MKRVLEGRHPVPRRHAKMPGERVGKALGGRQVVPVVAVKVRQQRGLAP
jgi:hypothetical protein